MTMSPSPQKAASIQSVIGGNFATQRMILVDPRTGDSQFVLLVHCIEAAPAPEPKHRGRKPKPGSAADLRRRIEALERKGTRNR